jgi:hypothetical protein
MVIQSTAHYYIYTAASTTLLKTIQDDLYDHLERITDPNPSPDNDPLPLPAPASTTLYRVVHQRSAASKRAAKKARLTPAAKQELWTARREHDRQVGIVQRTLLLSQRLAPNHTVSPPLGWSTGARQSPRYNEVFNYYSAHAGGDQDLDVLWGYEHPNITGDLNQRGVFAARDISPGKRFPYVGFLLRNYPSQNDFTHTVFLYPLAVLSKLMLTIGLTRSGAYMTMGTYISCTIRKRRPK